MGILDDAAAATSDIATKREAALNELLADNQRLQDFVSALAREYAVIAAERDYPQNPTTSSAPHQKGWVVRLFRSSEWDIGSVMVFADGSWANVQARSKYSPNIGRNVPTGSYDVSANRFVATTLSERDLRSSFEAAIHRGGA